MATRDDDVRAQEWRDLMRRYHRTSCALDRALTAQHGITGSDFEVLQQLQAAQEDGGMVRMHELGDKAHLTQSALSRLVSRLERDGLVERGMCADDRRSVWTKITPAGIDLFRQARPTQRAILRTADLQCTEDEELAALG